ncbi:MAG TPA: phosphatidate cytidylyltransferase [Chitinophagaceae bacterium]|nr:phosphatidate cytidylyltransferase [Chitinophagaceae bacterium]
MAFNFQTFKTRTITSIVFVIVMLAGLLWNQWSFFILFSIIHFGCWWEYLKLVEKICKTEIDKVIKYFFIFCGYVLMIVVSLRNVTINFWIGRVDFEINIKWLIWAGSFVLLLIFLFQNKVVAEKAKWMSVAGLVYISLSIGLLLNLSGSLDDIMSNTEITFFSPFIPCLIIFSIWINDTMAYIVGSLIGKTPLSKISPQKTWEGTMGGVILAIVVSFICLQIIYSGLKVEAWKIVMITAIAAITGTFGDLFESKLKRMANVKDSGTLMPGHGGFLDRFDSLLFAIPFVWLYVYFFMK